MDIRRSIATAGVWLLFLTPVPLFAHGGGVDAEGCHTNAKTGERHCHDAREGVTRKNTETQNTIGFAQTGDLTRQIQTQLVRLGYHPGNTVGLLDIQTDRAIRQFQTDIGLESDGSTSQELLRLLEIYQRADE